MTPCVYCLEIPSPAVGFVAHPAHCPNAPHVDAWENAA